MKRVSKMLLLTLLSVIFIMTIPGKAFAKTSSTGEWVDTSTSGSNIIERVTYSDSADGTVTVNAQLSFLKSNSKSNFVFYAFNDAGDLIFEKEEAKKGGDVKSDGGSITYTFKHTFNPGIKVKIFGYAMNDDDEAISEGDAFKAAGEITIPTVEVDPVEGRTQVNPAPGAVAYSGAHNLFGNTVYQLNAAEDAFINITGFTSTDSSAMLYIMEPVATSSGLSSSYYIQNFYGNARIRPSDANLTYYVKKGTYFLVVEASKGSTFSFNMEFRNYVHPNIVWSAQEGDINEAFPQRKDIHVTVKIANPDSDAYFPSDMTYSAPGTSGEAMTVAADGKSASFTFRTKDQASVTTISIGARELNPENGSWSVAYNCDIMTGVDISGIVYTTGHNYLTVETSGIPDYGQGKKSTVTVSLKNGNNWVKKFTATAGSKGKKIGGLKPNKKYEFKVEMAKELPNGKIAKTEKVYSVKTGSKQKPVITSAKISNRKSSKVWIKGYWSGRVWHPGHYTTIKSYTLTVTLKSSLKGCKGIVYAGTKAKGKGRVFKFNCRGNAPSKVSVRGYSNDTYGGYTPLSASKGTR